MRVEKRKVSRTGIASLGWHLGHGYVQKKITVKSDVWCILQVATVIAECRSEKKAARIAEALNKAWNV